MDLLLLCEAGSGHRGQAIAQAITTHGIAVTLVTSRRSADKEMWHCAMMLFYSEEGTRQVVRANKVLMNEYALGAEIFRLEIERSQAHNFLFLIPILQQLAVLR